MSTMTHASPTRPPATAAARPFGGVATTQGLFYLATGTWPLIDVDSFQAVTGAKTDLWLVYAVGVLVAVIGIVLLRAAASGRVSPEVVSLAVGVALALAGIDAVFVARGVIPPVYLADAGVEVALVAWWAVAARSRRRRT